jgi:hypothetical protein
LIVLNNINKRKKGPKCLPVNAGGDVSFARKRCRGALENQKIISVGNGSVTTVKKIVGNDHLCYMRARENKDSNSKYIFCDFECTQENVFQCQEGYRPLRKPDCSSCKDMFERDPCFYWMNLKLGGDLIAS